jgi:serine kinase of HPr protein (carbohydrate metabolism regulator)
MPTIHASAVLLGARAVLIQGPPGAGKSRLALALVAGPGRTLFPFTRLVADDRCEAEAVHGRLLVRPPAVLAGLIEVRGLGIRQVPYEPVAVIGLVMELGLPHADRLPQDASRTADIAGVALPRLAVATGDDPLHGLVAALRTDTRT